MEATISRIVCQAKEFMIPRDIDGWLLYDYRGMNPIFWETIGYIPNVTRPCWLWIPAKGDPKLLVSQVDQNRFVHLGIDIIYWSSRHQMVKELGALTKKTQSIAMEYSTMGMLPRASKIDAGTLELVRDLGVDVVSSADLVQFTTQRWDDLQLESHIKAAEILNQTVKSAFDYIGCEISSSQGEGPTEFEIAEFVRARFERENLYAPDGPVVAANAHAADPHFEPTADNSSKIKTGDWILIDLWGRLNGDRTVCSDITWTAYVGSSVPHRYQEVFDVVVGGRDAAVNMMEKSHSAGRELQGWELDSIARKYITERGYGDFFSHRLGHSLGREVHGNAVNLDGWETSDTRHLIPRIAVTIEPGIYIPGEFGVRSEIDVFYHDSGPMVTTERQMNPYLIEI